MPTIDELRAALMSLESEAPEPEAVLLPVPTSRESSHGPVIGGRRTSSVISGLLLAAVAAVVVFTALHSGWSRSNGAASDPHRTGDGTQRSVLIPFRLSSALEQVQVADVSSNTAERNPSGTAVLVEYGMEVTVYVDTNVTNQVHAGSASQVPIGSATGWIDTDCGLRAGISSTTPAAEDEAVTPSSFNPACSLSFTTGPWRVLIYVAGPGGGTRDISTQQFEEIGTRLQLASSTDSSSWFRSGDLLPH